MKIEIVWEGKSLQPHERKWIDEYSNRIQKYGRLNLTRVKNLEKIKYDGKKMYRVVLDEKGRSFSTAQLTQHLQKIEQSHKGVLQFIVGGAYGVPETIKQSSDLMLSLSKFTMPHRLALLVLIEQVYRSLSFKAGDPYHHV